ncbi:hypothetical protein [Shewanella khirikhana]|uniref:DUF4157 domain-containing protein n=1 Tax=Shewanella khirikhana TaxID=1965282 RepID=A0ABM7CZ88_9GAMM|nr:hypothetical protein [Shewanella khirikhana]AZQ09440.1 hypothetical protein STH12_00288 [Shewanella khirikhana]
MKVVLSMLLIASAASTSLPINALATELQKQSTSEGINLWTDGTGDSEQLSHDLQQARTSFAKYLMEPTPLDVVLVKDSAALLNLKKTSESTASVLHLTGEMLAIKPDRQAQIVRHEACHVMAINGWAMAGLATGDTKGLAYGHPEVADWLDETLAVMCEPEGSRLREEFSPIPLEKFMAMPHPVMAQMQQQILAMQQQREDENSPMVMVFEQQKTTNNAIDFYIQSAWIREFILAEVGTSGLKSLYLAVAQGQDPAEYLKAAMNADNWQRLDQRFHAFLADKARLSSPDPIETSLQSAL